jgi:hypothetical protein
MAAKTKNVGTLAAMGTYCGPSWAKPIGPARCTLFGFPRKGRHSDAKDPQNSSWIHRLLVMFASSIADCAYAKRSGSLA